MIGTYAYTPSIWPSVFTTLFLTALYVYSWRRRGVPGALPFAISCLFAALWAACSVLEYAAVDLATKIFWVKIQPVWQFPVAIAITCFILEYAWPGRWLTRRNLALLCIPWLLTIPLILTDNLHHLIWRSFAFNGSVQPQLGPGGWLIGTYPFGVLVALDLIVFGWLFVRSPQHRWPVALMLIGQIGGRMLYLAERIYVFHSVLPFDLLGMALEFLMYAIALFGFRIFDPISLARQTAIQQIPIGMLVLDPQGKIVGLNPAAAATLGSPAKLLLGRPIQDLLPDNCNLVGDPQVAEVVRSEISLGSGAETRSYQLEASALNDWRGLVVGRLLLLHDVTDQKRAQAQLVEQQRALAMLQERVQLARELHDGLGQALAAAHLQASTAKLLLDRGEADQVGECLNMLAETTLQAEADMREYLLGTQTVVSTDRSFFATLRDYLVRYTQQYGLPVELIVIPELEGKDLAQTVAVQLLRIIQEALSNIRKHAHAQCAQVRLTISGTLLRVVVSDDGLGFDPAMVPPQPGAGFGLRSMRERAEALGGVLRIDSAPGHGTCVVIELPLNGK